MRWLIAALLVAGSAAFLYQRYQHVGDAPAQGSTTFLGSLFEDEPAKPAPAPAPAPKPLSPGATAFLTVDELKRVHASASDGDPGVRWTALELLFTFKAADSAKLLEKAAASDPDPDLRVKAIKLLATSPEPERVPTLVKGLQDYDPTVRLESLKALAATGDYSASPWVVGLISDPDPDVKMQAFKTLEQMNERKQKQFRELADTLRTQYEEAIRRSQKRQSREAD